MKKIFALVLAMVCICLSACNNTAQVADPWQNATYTADAEFGSGAKTVTVKVEVIDNSITFELHTDKDTLGDALTEHGLISGEQGAYGMYVKQVNGITADYDTDKAYWAITKSGESLLTGVDSTKIAHGESYEFVYTK